MAEYISRDDLLNVINSNVAEKHNERCSQLLEAILKAPTADVVEVKRGEWREVNEKYPRYVCTVCNHLFNNKNYNYCPCCGAKMDGKE